MSTPNPINPQGSLLEQKAKRKNNLPVIVAIFLGIHAVVLGGILMAGCKPEPKPEPKRPAPEPVLPPITPPADLGLPVPPAPGTLPPVGSVPTPPPVAPITPPPIVTPPPVAPITPPSVVTPPPVAITPPPAAPDPTPGEAKTHVVIKGEYFEIIAKKYGVTVKAIEGANPGVDSTKLKIGQKLNIPASTPKTPKATAAKTADSAAPDADSSTHIVKSGDVLGTIARKYGTSVDKLREANGLKTDRITVGQKLKLPAGGTKALPAPSSSTTAPKTEPAPVTPALPTLSPASPLPIEPTPTPKP